MQRAVVVVAIGLAVLAWPGDSRVPEILFGVILFAMGARISASRRSRARRGTLTGGVVLMTLGALLLMAPWGSSPVAEQLVEIMIKLTVSVGLALAGILIASSFGPRGTGLESFRDAFRVATSWLAARPVSDSDRQDLYRQILYAGSLASQTVKRYLILMSLAAAIAAMGVIADSTVAVLAGMLIAPLMLPLMGMSISLVNGWPRRLARLSVVALLGIGVTVGVAVLVAFVDPGLIDTGTNSQIVSRTVPTLRDLTIALAAGAAGAYALSRPDVSNSLPGAAVAISLVPPLTVAGVALATGELTAASGALLLFATNTLAILIMGGMVFVLTGIASVPTSAITKRHVRVWLTVGAATIAVTAVLFLNGAQLQSGGTEVGHIEATVEDWLGDGEYYVDELDYDGDTVTAVVIGPDSERPDAAELANLLAEQLDQTVTVEVQFFSGEFSTATSG